MEQFEEELLEERQRPPGLRKRQVEQMTDEKVEKVGVKMKEEDLTGTAGQEGWKVELLVLGLGSEDAEVLVGLEGEECCRVTPH